MSAPALADFSRAEMQALIACTFLWRGFRIVFPSDACWLSDCVLAVRESTVTAVYLLDDWDEEQLLHVQRDTCRLRRTCPGTYNGGVVVRGRCSRAARAAGRRMGIRVRDRYELANMIAADDIPAGAVEWALGGRCGSVGETVERLREARMVP